MPCVFREPEKLGLLAACAGAGRGILWRRRHLQEVRALLRRRRRLGRSKVHLRLQRDIAEHQVARKIQAAGEEIARFAVWRR